MTDASTDALRHLLEAGPRPRPIVFVTVGSDHHPFDRLVSWVDSWAARNDVDCVVQYGTARPPRHAHGIAYLDKDLLEALLQGCDVAVAQGGPMSIIEARRSGRLPIVAPRDPALKEVVDGHQIAFCRRLETQGLIWNAEDESGLHRHLDEALRDPSALRVEKDNEAQRQAARAINRLAHTADDLVLNKLDFDDERPRVLLLGGAGRSGSTLLERMLGTSDAVTELGETLHLWERGLRDDEMCGCELPFSECPFWVKVGEEAFEGWDHLDAGDMVGLRHHVVRSRHAFGLLAFAPKAGWRLERDRLVRTVTAMYRAAAKIGTADVLIDSSKHPAYAMLLRRAPVDLRCVLVVRDPRAVAYAWTRSVRRPEVVAGNSEMPRYPVVRTALVWQFYSMVYAALRAAGVPVMTVRYEDLLEDPRGVLQRVLAFGGLGPAHLSDAVTDDSVRLDVGHTVAGNPMRFQVGDVPLVRDDRWRSEMSRWDRLRVSLVSAAGRRWHGYR